MFAFFRPDRRHIAFDPPCPGFDRRLRGWLHCLICLITLIIVWQPSQGVAQQQWCVTYTCPNCAAHGAGPNSQTACFPTQAACQAEVNQAFAGKSYYGSHTDCTPNGAGAGASSADGSLNGLVKQSGEAIGKGIAYGSGQLVGMGLAGLGVAMLLSGSNEDPQQAALAEQQRQAELQRQEEESRRAQAEIMRQQELARQRIMHDLKDTTDTGSSLQIKNDSDKPLMVAQVDSSFGTHVLVPVSTGQQALGGMQLKGFDDTPNTKLAANAGFDTSGKLMGADAAMPDVATPEAAPVLTREGKIQQVLQRDPDYVALSQKREQQEQTLNDAQKKLDDLKQQQQVETDADKKNQLDEEIAEQSKQLDTAKQEQASIISQMKTIETKIAGRAEIVD